MSNCKTWGEYLDALKEWLDRNPELSALSGPTNPNDPPPPPPLP